MSNPASAESVVSRHNEGHGRRLTGAFEALEAFPALAESRNRVLRVVREDQTSVGEVVAAVESDVALVITVLRIANRSAQRKKGKIASIPDAVDVLSPEGVETLAARSATFDFFERTPGWDVMPERFRLHAVATQAAMAAVREANTRMAELNADRKQNGLGEIRYGIGLHVGNVMYGNVGLKDRLTFSAFGGAVNEVQRLTRSWEIPDHKMVQAMTIQELGGTRRAVEAGTAALKEMLHER